MIEINRYSVLTGPNTKQLWVYDEVNDTYIDPPADILDEIDEKFDWDDWQDKENALQEIVNQNPDWLQDKEYTYDADHIDI